MTEFEGNFHGYYLVSAENLIRNLVLGIRNNILYKFGYR